MIPLCTLWVAAGAALTLLAQESARVWRRHQARRVYGDRAADALATRAQFSEDFGQDDTRVICGDCEYSGKGACWRHLSNN